MRPPINKLLHCPSHLLNLIIQKVRPVFSSPCANEADISCRTLLNALNLVRIYRRLDRCTLFPVDIKLGMSAIGESGKLAGLISLNVRVRALGIICLGLLCPLLLGVLLYMDGPAAPHTRTQKLLVVVR